MRGIEAALKIGFDVTLEDHVAFARYMRVHDPDQSKQAAQFRWMLAIIGPIVALVFYLFTKELVLCSLTVVLVVVCAIAQPKMAGWGLAKQLKQNHVIQESLGAVEYEIAEEGLISRKNHAESMVFWQGIWRIVLTDDYGFVLVDPTLAHAIPRHRLTSGDYDAFIAELMARWQKATGNG